MRALAAALLLCALIGRPAAGQRPDSTRADSLRADSTRADTAATDYSALFLKTYEEGRTRVPVFPRLGRPALLPALSRLVFDRDSIEWHNAETVSDLLSKVPGVFVWRGGWIGRPEPINYQGRTTASADFLVDGMPLRALGPDSLGLDPSLLPLSFFDRVEVERLPGQLRVHLFSRRHDRLPPRTRVGVASGDLQIARYLGSLEKRSAGGFGYVVAGEYLASPLRTGDQGAFHNTQTWLQASYVPAGPVQAMVQLFRGGPRREPVLTTGADGSITSASDTLIQGLAGKRSDFMATVVYQRNRDGTGLRAALLAGASSWREDSTALALSSPDRHVRYLDQSVTQLGGTLSARSRTSSFEGQVWYRTRWTPMEVRASAASTPFGALAAGIEAVYQRHDGGRTSRWLTGRAGLVLPFGIRATALVRTGSWVATPARYDAEAVGSTDLGALAAIGGARASAEVGYWRTGGFRPEAYATYRTIDTVGASGPTKWLTVSARLAPKQWLVLDGWYSNPVGVKPEGQAPTHSIVNATIQSKFLPTFRSGIFVLKLQGSMETWGTGVLGRDRVGAAVPLKGATFFRAQIQFKIGDFVAYYDRVNLQASRLGYLPDLPLLRLASTFGVRWEFSN